MNDRVEISYEGCGYGAVVRQFPARYPMCGGAIWSERGATERQRRL
jgi:hypothetical protein